MRSLRILWALAFTAVIGGAALVPSPAEADFQGFLKIPGLPGESADRIHQDEIELISYTQTVTPAKGCFKGVAIKSLDKASPGLALLAVTNQVIPQATVTLAKSGQAPFDALVVVLKNVIITTVELVEVDGTPIPTERVVLLPRRATLTYRAQNLDGSPGPTTTTTVVCPP
jgi:type VI protein secretion system component Hcp